MPRSCSAAFTPACWSCGCVLCNTTRAHTITQAQGRGPVRRECSCAGRIRCPRFEAHGTGRRVLYLHVRQGEPVPPDTLAAHRRRAPRTVRLLPLRPGLLVAKPADTLPAQDSVFEQCTTCTFRLYFPMLSCRRPSLVGGLATLGIVLFSGRSVPDRCSYRREHGFWVVPTLSPPVCPHAAAMQSHCDRTGPWGSLRRMGAPSLQWDVPHASWLLLCCTTLTWFPSCARLMRRASVQRHEFHRGVARAGIVRVSPLLALSGWAEWCMGTARARRCAALIRSPACAQADARRPRRRACETGMSPSRSFPARGRRCAAACVVCSMPTLNDLLMVPRVDPF